jgi:curved DNA-binding protein
MEYKDYYKIMGVSRNVTQDDLKKTYRKLAREFHPDVSKAPNAEQRFKEINEAYEVLKDPEKRAAYDRLGSNWRNGDQFRPPPDWDVGFEFSSGNNAGFSDFFDTFFGRSGFNTSHSRHHRARKGEDHHAKIQIALEDSFNGAQHSIQLQLPTLNERGQLVNKIRMLNVKIPKGITEGQKIRLVGQGIPSHGGMAGDLFLEVVFAPHKFYRIENKDIFLDLPLAPWEAALGAVVKVPTPTGAIELKIPENTQTGKKLRLKGRGIPSVIAGDFYVIIQIVTPPATQEIAKHFYQRMQSQFETFNPRAELN